MDTELKSIKIYKIKIRNLSYKIDLRRQVDWAH